MCLLLAVASCKTKKEATSIALPALSARERVDRIVQSEVRYADLSADLRLSIRQGTGKETSVDAQLRIVRNEAIQLSLRVPILGEAFRVVVTPDTVCVIDRLHKQFLREDIGFLKFFSEFDYYSLEALLTNRLFMAGKREIDAGDYSAFRIDDDGFRTQVTYLDPRAIRYDFESDYTHRILSVGMKPAAGSSYLQCDYTDWGLASNKRTFPMTLRLQFHTADKVYALNCAYRSALFDTGLPAIDESVPAKYRRLSSEQLILLIRNLL
jgi:hypothetical protein